MNGQYRRRRGYALAGTLAVLWPAVAAWSQTAPPFAQLLNQTRDVPRVAILNADVARARGIAEQARARPNPSINVYAENFAGDLSNNARNQQQTTFQIDQPIELGGKRSSRIAAGEAGIVAAEARNLDGRPSTQPSWRVLMQAPRSLIVASLSPKTKSKKLRPTLKSPARLWVPARRHACAKCRPKPN